MSDESDTLTDPKPFYPWGPKGMLVALYGLIGAGVASTPPTEGGIFPTVLIPRLEASAWVLLAIVVYHANCLKRAGKVSASWAVLAYGSLCVALIKLLVSVIWYASDDLRNQWVILAIMSGIGGAVIIYGLWSAQRALWGLMFGMSLIAMLQISFLWVSNNYSQHFYCHRNHLYPKRQPAPMPSSTPPVPATKQKTAYPANKSAQ